MNWTKSTKCTDSGCCVEVSFEGPDPEYPVAVRNSNVPNEVLWFTRVEWKDFIDGVAEGDFRF